MSFTYLINFNVFSSPARAQCLRREYSTVTYILSENVVLIQWRHHTGSRDMFTRLPQQTVSSQSQINVLQENTHGRRNNKHSHVEHQIQVITCLYGVCIWRQNNWHFSANDAALITSHNVWWSAQSVLFYLAASSFHLPPQVMINNGFTPDREDYEFCTKVDNMVIPSEGFFGISAATGGLAGTILTSVSCISL